MPVDWSTLLTVEIGIVTPLFTTQAFIHSPKLKVRGYTIPFTGTQQETANIMSCLRRQLIKYVFPEAERPEDIDWALARDKFGDNDPASDGKLGEMLLYVFVEAFLKTPLMAYKLKDLQNPNDQVKGADGVFIGHYDGQIAVLIGESKIHQSLSGAISSSMESLYRFHSVSGTRQNELLIAKKYPPQRELSADEASEIYGLLDGTTNRVLVHPVFISYDCAQIGGICSSARDASDAEQQLKTYLASECAIWHTSIDGFRTHYAEPFQVYLDFFFLPVSDCLRLRHSFYEMLHGHPYESAAVRSAVKKALKKSAPKAPPAKKSAKNKKKKGGS